MHKSEFSYFLPRHLIAQRPVTPRSAGRLLFLDGAQGGLRDMHFRDLPALLRPDDLLVMNDTRVLPARVFGRKDTGGRVEALVERVLAGGRAMVQLRASKAPLAGQRITLEGGYPVRVLGRHDGFYELQFETDRSVVEVLERAGHVPLPPYIARSDDADDRERYQTVYARTPGAVAAPTAGLHFDDDVLAAVRARGVRTAFITLHVGAGTFQPLRVDDVREHRMHAEYLEIQEAVARQINEARESGRRVIAVGTTVVRALETAVRDDGRVKKYSGETDIFIYPPYRFRGVDAVLTNFHLPESTLLMLVCAFAGTENVLAAYRHAVDKQYRFYSYGDAMFVLPGDHGKRQNSKRYLR